MRKAWFSSKVPLIMFLFEIKMIPLYCSSFIIGTNINVKSIAEVV